MNRTARTLGLVLAGAAVALAGCSTSDDAGAHGAASPSATRSATDVPAGSTGSGGGLSPLRRIPPQMRRTVLHSRITDLSQVPRTAWLQDDSDHLTITRRILPGCDDRTALSVAVDRDVLDFGWSLEHLPDGYTVARQLTVYPTVEDARAFVREAEHVRIGCRTGLLDGRPLVATSRTGFGPDRFFGVKDNHDGSGFSEGQLSTGRRSAAYIDVATRQANVVALTRVLNPDYAGHDITTEKDENPGFVAVVRREGTASARLLDAFE